ncbi:hypothetical protein [Hydrogenivirga sp. 128-5-R1-1]|uniref:hypothetical protein n=1 Tax=Hydrogenivirga sp. 128-5-R1-1 TaxID=392423 RepID=UPI00015EF978|nr:hypothetical protein [Hydrogenivirga sp. 128-5-R1-1]EDP75148.1 hypothetical protein HG1285_00250 [Hydrogenivirga sp. 128-5-R1-1]
MRSLILSGVLLGSSLGFALEVYVSPKYFLWEEFDSSGNKLLDETGLILGLGLRGDAGFFTGEAELYGGTVRYDGQTQAGDPVETDTNYLGVSAAGGVWGEAGSTVRLRGELLYRSELWVRDIESTSKAVGYSETWFFDSIDLGLRLSSGGTYAYGKYRYMFRDARMQASLTGVPELSPKKGQAYELGAGLKGSSYGIELSYSYVKFRRSEPKPYGSGYVLQPESVRQIISLKFISLF